MDKVLWPDNPLYQLGGLQNSHSLDMGGTMEKVIFKVFKQIGIDILYNWSQVYWVIHQQELTCIECLLCGRHCDKHYMH